MKTLAEIMRQIPGQLSKYQRANGITLSSADLNDGAYCCLRCRKEIRRLNLTLFGKPFRPLPVCQCVSEQFEREQKERELAQRRSRIKQIYGEGLIDEELKKASFANFEVRPGTEKVYQIAKRFAEDFKNQKHGLYLFGPVGTGKSHLAAAIHHALLEQGYASVYIDVTQLFGLAKSSFKDRKGWTDQDYIQAAINCDLLTLDEIGLAPLTDYEFRVLFQILNGRKGKLTNFTSNLDLDRLERWFSVDKHGNPLDTDGRLFDRLIGNTQPIHVNAPSYRKYKALQRMGVI